MDKRNDKITSAARMPQYTHMLLFTLAVAVLCGVCATPVFAAAAGGLANLCNVITLNMKSGSVGAAVASIAVIGLGVGAALGRVSWTSAVVVAVGIAVIFGYGTIVGDLGGSDCGAIT